MTKIKSPRELYVHKVGAAYEMEQTVLEMLEELQEKANDSQLKQLLSHHYGETQQQIRNLEQVFRALGEEPATQSCPAIEGIEKEGETLLKQVDDSLNDAIILSGATETEHHEIAVYRGLITFAEAMGEEDIVALLQENLEQEEHTRNEVERATKQLAQRVATTARPL
jgi:ferritin-like metal-binding protein YciE